MLAAIGLLCRHYRLTDRGTLLLLALFGIATIRLMYRANVLWALVPESIRRDRGRVAHRPDRASS